MKNAVLMVIIFIGLISNIFPQTLFRSGHILTLSVGGVVWSSSSPNVPQLINMYNIEHNYTGNNAVSLSIDYFPGTNGNTYDAWHAMFVGESNYPGEDSLLEQYIQNNSIIVIKACWGASAIAPMGNPADTSVIDDEASATGRTYYRTQWHWRSFVRIMQSHPDKFFVIWTGIPLNPGPSYDGSIAHNFFIWAKDTLSTGSDPEFGAFPNNVYVFDAFHLLAVPTQTTQWGTAYWGMNPLYHDEGDNHPNAAGANAVAHPFIWEIFDAAIAYEQGGVTTFPLTVNLANGWNMVSIPGLLPTNQNVTSWWPGKDPNAGVYQFQGGYQTVTIASPGKGYWMKNIGAQSYNTGEEWPSEGIQVVAHNPITASSGWNLFGGYEQRVVAANLTTTPAGLISGSIYKYNNGFEPATTIDPGYGYWVKLTGGGTINIPAGGQSSPPKVDKDLSSEEFGKIIITDNKQKSYTLYTISNAETDLTQFDLPPSPPDGMFDIRFSSQRFAEDLTIPQTIEMSGVNYPVMIKAEGKGIIISDETGKELARLKSGEEVIINSAISKLRVSNNSIPSEYTLEQNYPNPFNPGTTIKFSIPEDVKNIRLIIYNSLGEKVSELVNTGLNAGTYNYSWNADKNASGIYIYKLISEKFVSTRKMLLLK